MRKLLLFFIPAALAAQCNVLPGNYANCPATGSPSGWTGCSSGAYTGCGTGPTYQAFVQGAGTALSASGNSVSNKQQPRMILTAQVSPAGVSFMTQDPKTCGGTSNVGPSGGCYYNHIGYAPDAASPYTGPTEGILGFIYRLKQPPPAGVGLSQLDINGWLGPLFKSSQYTAICATYGTCYPDVGVYSTWHTNSLATYDAVFAYLAASGVLVNFEPTMSGDTINICGIPSYGTYTEAQIKACEAPLEAAAASRWSIHHFSVDHEPCGVQELIYSTGGNCYLSVSDEHNLIASLSAAVRAVSPSTKIGAGAQYTDVGGNPYNPASATNYWNDWVTTLTGSMDYYAVHAYPVTIATNFLSQVLSLYGSMCAAVPSNRICLSDESSPLRYEPTGSTGEGNSIFGCGYISYWTDGTYSWWVSRVVGEWAPAEGFAQWAEFDAQRLIYVTSDPNNTHCSLSTDSYAQNVMLSLPASTGVSGEGVAFGEVANGYTSSLQGKVILSGPSRLDSVNGISNVVVSGVTAQQAMVSWNAATSPTCNVVASTTQINGVPQTPYVYDTDANTFSGSTAVTRPGSLVIGNSQTFVLGQRASQLATAGTYSGLRYFSRSVQPLTTYYGQISCGSSSALFNLTTTNIPLGQTYGDPWLVDPANPGTQPWPAILGIEPQESFLDPLSGADIVTVTPRGNEATPFNLSFASAFNQGQVTPCDSAGPWANPCGSGIVTSGSGTTSVGNSTAPLVLRINMSANNPWTTSYVSGFSIDQVAANFTGSVNSTTAAFRVLDACLSADGGVACAGPVQQVTAPQTSGAINFGQSSTTAYGTIPWLFDSSPRLNAQEMAYHHGTGTVSNVSGTYYLKNTNSSSSDQFSLYWIHGGAGTVRISTTSQADACISPPGTPVTGAEYRIVAFLDPTGAGLNGQYIQLVGTPPTGSVWWCEQNFVVMIWRDQAPTDGSTATLTAAAFSATGSYYASYPDNGAGTACMNTSVYGGFWCLYGGMYWMNPSTGYVAYFGQPQGAGPDGNGACGAHNNWNRAVAPCNESACIDQTQSNLTFYTVAQDPCSSPVGAPLVIQGVMTPTATPVQPTTPQSSGGITQVGNAPITATDAYSVTWSTSTPSPWSMTWTNLTPQKTLSASIVQQMAAFDSTFNPSYFDATPSGTWNCSLTTAATLGVFFFPCFSGGGDSPAWIFAYSPGDGNPAHAGTTGGPQIIGAINTFNTPQSAVSSSQSALTGRTLHTIVESGETGWIAIATSLNGGNSYISINTSANTAGIPSSGVSCTTYGLPSGNDCVLLNINSYTAHSVTGYEPYFHTPTAPWLGTPGEQRTTQIGDTVCISTSTTCNYVGTPPPQELGTLVIKNYGSVPGAWVIQRATNGVEKAIAANTAVTLTWESTNVGVIPPTAVGQNLGITVYWNPLTGCAGSPDPHGTCLIQDTNGLGGHGEWRGGGEAVGLNVPAWAVPTSAVGVASLPWPTDYQVIEGAIPALLRFPFANAVPGAAAGVNFVTGEPTFAGAYGVPFQPDGGTHPNAGGANVTNTTAFDNLPLQGGSYEPTFALVSGQLYSYIPQCVNNSGACASTGASADADDFYSTVGNGTPAQPNGATMFNRKLMATGAACGDHPLVDLSSAATGNIIATDNTTAYEYCIARNANECRTGSSVGEVFVNCPGVSFKFCEGLSIHGGIPFGAANDICVGNISKVPDTISQFTIAATDQYGADSRTLATATSTVRMVTGFENNANLPDNSWLLYRQEFLNLQAQQMAAVQLPAYPSTDSYNRQTFIPVNVPITTPGSLGITSAVVEFGYQEYAQSGTYYCTTRADVCQANAASIPSGFSPFKFASESASGLSCAVSCTIQVPAISQRVLYYRVRWLNGSTTVQVGAWNATVVP